MYRIKVFMIAIVAIVASVMAACAPAPLAPESPRETIAAVQAARSSAYSIIADLSQSGSLNRAQHDAFMAKMAEADQAIALATVALKEGKPQTQMEQLRLARSILMQVTRELAERKPKPLITGGLSYV